MTLKNKDGSPFRLRGPNPLMREQELWRDFKLHNFQFKGVVVADTTEVTPFESPMHVNDFVGELEATKPEPTVIEKQVSEFYGQKDPPLERPVVVLPDAHDQERREQKPIFHCLPAIIRRRRDALYGETYATVKYDAPFTFEAYVVDQSDFALQFWTSGPAAEKISEGSVIYPKLMEKRWWKVVSREEKSGGWLFSAIPSDYQPKFK